jgi:hypothetical protein
MKHPIGTSFEVIVRVAHRRSRDHVYFTEGFRHPGYHRLVGPLPLYQTLYTSLCPANPLDPFPMPRLRIGDHVKITCSVIAYGIAGQRRCWVWSWESVEEFQHEDLYGSGYEGYEYDS